MSLLDAIAKATPAAPVDEEVIRNAVTRARQAQITWSSSGIRSRLKILRKFRTTLPFSHTSLLRALSHVPRTPAQLLTSEILPLADACYFLEKNAERVLKPRKLGNLGRPTWLGRGSSQVRREPLGTILVIGPANYPLFIPGVQILQSLAVGNAVLVKPGRNGTSVLHEFAALLSAAGLDRNLVQILPEEPLAAQCAIEMGVDKVLLTGSSFSGRAVLDQLTPTLTPAVLELSGCDALLVLPHANLDRVASAARFAVLLNHGATCIAPRRLIAERTDAAALETKIVDLFAGAPAQIVDDRTFARVTACVNDALARGARIVSGRLHNAQNFVPIVLSDVTAGMKIAAEDLFAPILYIMPVENASQIIPTANACPFALGAAIFGAENLAIAASKELCVANIVINDVIVPTVDPRLPFPTRGQSGYGSTRGPEGLLELTQIKVVSTRAGSFLPHLEPANPNDQQLFTAYLHASHDGGFLRRLIYAFRFLRIAQRRTKT